MPKSMPAKKQTTESSTPKGSGKKGKGIIFTLFTFFLIIVIIAGVLGGAFYFVIHNNINGLGERYRKTIQNIPLARLALPPVADPLDPKYMTAKQIVEKYVEFRKANEMLKKQLDEAVKKQEELQKYKDEYDQNKAANDKAAADILAKQASMDAQQKQLDEYRKSVDQLVANGDKTGFRQYFEGMDSETAKQIYADVVKQQQIDENAKKFAQLYEAMDAATAAKIFEQMGTAKIDIVAETLKNMKKESSSAILSAMATDFASKVTEKLNSIYKAN